MGLRSECRSLLLALAERAGPVQRVVERVRARRLRRRRTAVVARPLDLHNIELTNKCPMRCVMCARTHGMTREQGFMSVPLFRSAVDQLAEAHAEAPKANTLWLHHFGESLLHPEFDVCMRYARGKGIPVGLSLNPLMLDAGRAERLLEAEPAKLYISLDGHDNESFRRIRGVPDGYERSCENLRRFLEMKQKRGTQTRVVLSMLDFSLNAESVRRTADRWQTLPGIDEFLLKEFTAWDGSIAEVNELVQRSSANRRASRRFVACNRPWQMMTVLWDGRVVPCCYDYNAKLVLGSLEHESLPAIWNGGSMQRLRGEFMDNAVGNPLCRNCPELYRFYT